MNFVLKLLNALRVLFAVKDDLEKLKKDIEKVFDKARALEDKQIQKAFDADADYKTPRVVVDQEFAKLNKVAGVVGLVGEAKKKLT